MATVPLPGPPLAVHLIDAAGQGRVVKQTIMIVEILATQGQGEDVLHQQRLHIVFDASGVTTIDEGTARRWVTSKGLSAFRNSSAPPSDVIRPPSNPVAIRTVRWLQAPGAVLYNVLPRGWASRRMQACALTHICYTFHPCERDLVIDAGEANPFR